jgi:hypothetical protein
MNPAAEPLVIDTRTLIAEGRTPCSTIDTALAELRPQQPLVLLVPFEPVPLYAKLGAVGFTHTTRQLEDGTWRVEFQPGDHPVSRSAIGPCACSGH